MRLIFFDIECAGVHKTYAKICAFGYVVCDENFNIIEKEDILINPRGRFELTDRKGEKGITLPYEYAEFKKYPAFTSVYKRIKALLEDKDAYVLGHAVLNDVKYLNLETQRFKLPSFRFKFYDSQLIYMTRINDFSRQFGLEHIAESLGVEFTPHRAADDAYATMRVVEAMCKDEGCSFEEILNRMKLSAGRIEDYSIYRPQSSGFKRYSKERRDAKERRADIRVKFNNHFLKKRFVKNGKLKGAVFTFTRKIEDDLDLSVSLVDRIYALGGKYSQQPENCSYFIKSENDDSARAKRAEKLSNVNIIDLAELEKLLND